ncbi:PH domain-containing protein [Candidatus Roizmanbacteria bacterium]|nr:PH domain-containing protein [Candidatus Roizmanbacteria bacterium]
MANYITENDYPVESTWILKVPVSFLIVTVFIVIFIALILLPVAFTESGGWLIFLIVIGMIIFMMVGIGILSMIIASLSKDNFHYSIEDEFVIFHQGIISKQQKNLPYSVIQDVIVNQDIADRMFNLASVTIENASFGGGQMYVKGRQAGALIGFAGNVAVIPGLTIDHAEALKKILLSKIKQFGSTSKAGL